EPGFGVAEGAERELGREQLSAEPDPEQELRAEEARALDALEELVGLAVGRLRRLGFGRLERLLRGRELLPPLREARGFDALKASELCLREVAALRGAVGAVDDGLEAE